MKRFGFTDLDHLCACTRRVLSVRRALSDVGEEIVELFRAPFHPENGFSADIGEEISDIAYATGRLIGALFGQTYCRVPGDSAALMKIKFRALTTGCIRSLRHRKDGECATAGKLRIQVRCGTCGRISAAAFRVYSHGETFQAPCVFCGDDRATYHIEVVPAAVA